MFSNFVAIPSSSNRFIPVSNAIISSLGVTVVIAE